MTDRIAPDGRRAPASRDRVRLTVILAFAWLPAGCAPAPRAVADGAGAAIVTSDLGRPDPFTVSAGATTDYRIGPGDVVQVTVFQADELDRTAEVDSAGHVSLPLIGPVDAANRTAAELSAEIAARLGARYLQDPEVGVSVKEARSQRITLEGALNQPGVYPVVGRTSLLQAVAIAKGADRTADLKRVIVFRRIAHQRMAATFDLESIQTGKAADPELYGGDVVVLNESGGKRMFYNLVQSSPVLALFRPF